MSGRVISQAILGVLALSTLGAAGAGLLWGLPSFLLALAGGALGLVIVLMWSSLQQMEESDEMEFEQALFYAAPSAEEEQKRALLRTLKDLEYELSVGKISREDYDQVYAEVAEKAKRMIALTDEAMKARLLAAEARVASRLENPEPSMEKGKSKKNRPSAEKSDEKGPAREEREAEKQTVDREDDTPPSDSLAVAEDAGDLVAGDQNASVEKASAQNPNVENDDREVRS